MSARTDGLVVCDVVLVVVIAEAADTGEEHQHDDEDHHTASGSEFHSLHGKLLPFLFHFGFRSVEGDARP